MINQKMSNTVRQHRTENGLTQQQLAERVGVSRQTIVAIEKGNYTPSVLLAITIAQSFESSVEDIFICKHN